MCLHPSTPRSRVHTKTRIQNERIYPIIHDLGVQAESSGLLCGDILMTIDNLSVQQLQGRVCVTMRANMANRCVLTLDSRLSRLCLPPLDSRTPIPRIGSWRLSQLCA